MQNEWIYIYGGIAGPAGAGRAYRLRAAGAAEQTGTETLAQVGAGQTMGVGGIVGDYGEQLMWNKDLTASEWAQWISYANDKYGTLPHT